MNFFLSLPPWPSQGGGGAGHLQPAALLGWGGSGQGSGVAVSVGSAAAGGGNSGFWASLRAETLGASAAGGEGGPSKGFLDFLNA